jgi:hypothetical protein
LRVGHISIARRYIYRRFLSHVSDECERRRSRKPVSRLRELCGVEIEQRERRALIRESPSYRGTDAVRWTGDDDHSSVIRSIPFASLFDGLAVASVATIRRLRSTSAKALFRGRWLINGIA